MGSLVGVNEGDLTNVSSSSDVAGDGNRVGGLVGLNYEGEVSETYATGDVDGDNNVGGLVGFNFGDVDDSYWDDESATITEGID